MNHYPITVQALLRIFYDNNVDVAFRKKQYKNLDCWVIREIGGDNCIYYDFTNSEIFADEKGNMVGQGDKWIDMIQKYIIAMKEGAMLCRKGSLFL